MRRVLLVPLLERCSIGDEWFERWRVEFDIADRFAVVDLEELPVPVDVVLSPRVISSDSMLPIESDWSSRSSYSCGSLQRCQPLVSKHVC